MLGLGHNRRTRPAPARAGAHDGDSVSVATPRAVAHVLGHLAESRCLLNVTVPGSGRTHVSTLLAVDVAADEISIDEPATGKIDAGAPIEVSARVDGVLVRFITTVNAHGTDSGGALYRLALPERLERRQRRAHHRAPVTLDRPITATLTMGEDEDGVDVEIRDLSIGGMCARLEGRPSWPASDATFGCELHVGDPGPVRCEFQIRRTYEQRGATVLAGRFLSLQGREALTLERFVAGLEREFLRKRQRR